MTAGAGRMDDRLRDYLIYRFPGKVFYILLVVLVAIYDPGQLANPVAIAALAVILCFVIVREELKLAAWFIKRRLR